MALVEISRQDKIGWLVMNRPEKLNALSRTLLKEFDEALAALTADNEVRCIIIRGEGRAFSTGYDLSPENELFGTEQQRIRAYDDWISLREGIDRWLTVWRCPKPVIAAVQGYCLGGATQLAVCCDLTVCADDAFIGWPMLPMGGGLLAPVSEWLIGPKRAKEMAYMPGNHFTGVEAAEWGWANRSVPEDALLDTVQEMARKICKVPPDVMMIKKRALNRIMDMQGFSESLYFVADFDAIGHDSEGCAALVRRVEEIGLKAVIAEYHES